MEMQNDDGLQGSEEMSPFWDYDFTNLKGDELLDYLVGSDINLSDVNSFGTDERSLVNGSPPAIVKAEKSPWHESDSGVSDILSVGSPSDLSSAGNMSVGDPFQESVFYHKETINIYPEYSATSGKIVSQFLSEKNEASSSVKTTQTGISRTETHISASGRPTRRCSRKPQIELSDSEDSESTESQPKKRPPSSVQYVTCNKNEMSSSGRANVVNIVKIIKPATHDTTSDDILKALDEKSKKNAQQAKINREKKKTYIKSLEDDRDNLVKENSQLSTKIGRMTEEMQDLQEEVCYLKSVLANSSSLSELLGNISNVKNVKLSASMTNHKRAFEGDHSYMSSNRPPAKKTRFVRENFEKAGVCLHVSDGEACLEFCAHCSLLARKTREQS